MVTLSLIHIFDPTLISSLLDSGYIPVIATVGMDDLGQAYNVNADTAAAPVSYTHLDVYKRQAPDPPPGY